MAKFIIIFLVISIALITAGLLAVLIGVIAGFVAGPEWLLISLGGLVFIALGIGIIGFQIRKFSHLIHTFKSNFNSTRTRIKR